MTTRMNVVIVTMVAMIKMMTKIKKINQNGGDDDNDDFDEDSYHRQVKELQKKAISRFTELRTFARNFFNIDFFLKLLPL